MRRGRGVKQLYDALAGADGLHARMVVGSQGAQRKIELRGKQQDEESGTEPEFPPT